ncbi:hypothetical protein BKA70DRAFT_1250880 [Coprinopsis sp. MPI-PUGE-AT-0042]|nr:hypothetical protein BKA70DRAFT_1250880 [Coprinopsis sp. MPI-PUGE-AT-0042]
MDAPSPSSPVVKKMESDDGKDDKRDVKPVIKTLNRNACRKQKMRCEGAENPPCRRCRNAGLECLFEKPSREASLTGEAGLERMRALEAQVADIRQTQTTICANIQEILSYVRAAAHTSRSPSAYPSGYQQSPPIHSPSPSLSTPTAPHQHVSEIHHPSPPVGHNVPPSQSILHPPGPRAGRASMPNIYPSSGHHPAMGEGHGHSPHAPPQGPYSTNMHQPHGGPSGPSTSSTVLPPFSSISNMRPPPGPSNVSSVRHQPHEKPPTHDRHPGPSTGTKRQAPASSTVTSADSSDVEDDDDEGLPASGLVAPWEVLRSLADVAVARASKEGGDYSEPQSRARTPSPHRSRPSKRRKIRHMPSPAFHDIVTKGIISEDEARELFKIFFDGCSTFLPIFDVNCDTFEALHERSPFAVDAICMVAARVRDAGGPPSEVHQKLLEEVHNTAKATLFAPVLHAETIQAMILISGWSDNGWLSGGHAVRMAMELSMHKAWPRLHRRIIQNKANRDEDKELVIHSRIWFCLYLFEHQMSYGTGRPAVLKDDETIQGCRDLLQHPLAIDDDMRLVSTVELIQIRERVNNAMSPLEGPILKTANQDFEQWFRTWDKTFSNSWPDAAFYRQSLQIQQYHAQLFHYATALRGINGPEDVQRMPHEQRQIAMQSIAVAQKGLDITVNSTSYREGMKYAVHYTHATATFAASFLLRLARLFPNDCNMMAIRGHVEHLSGLMGAIPGKRYALTLQLMLKRSRKPKEGSTRSPKAPNHPGSQNSLAMVIDHNPSNLPPSGHAPQHHQHPFSPTYPVPYPHPNQHMQQGQAPPHYPHYSQHPPPQSHGPPGPPPTDVDQIWQGLSGFPQEQLPVWISDQSLGGNSFSQHGMDAFLLPNDPVAAPQIW